MRNPTPGKNPFELGSYIDRFPLVFQWLYIDLNRDFFKLKGRTGVSRFWAMYIFSFIFLGIVYWICEKLATTVIVYFSLLLASDAFTIWVSPAFCLYFLSSALSL